MRHIEVIQTERAPRRPVPISQALRAGDLLFVSGQLPIRPEAEAALEGDIAAQTRQVLENVQAIVEAAGGALSDVVKTTCFLAGVDDVSAFNAVYRTFFDRDAPARSVVQVVELSNGSMVEIEAIAYLPAIGGAVGG